MVININAVKSQAWTDKFKFSRNLIGFDEYLDKALFDSMNGYYLKDTSIKEDFITPSTLNSFYINSLIKFISNFKSENFIEIGIGDGQFSKKYVESSINQDIYLVDLSEKKLSQIKEVINQKNVHFSKKQPKLTKTSFCFLQEVLDCLPVRYFVYRDELVYEKKINLENFKIEEVLTEDDLIINYAWKLKLKSHANTFQFLDFSKQISFLKEVYENIEQGWVLIIDYGYRQKELVQSNQLVDNLLRAYKNHQQIQDFIKFTGDVDITYDLDFDILMESWVNFGGTVAYYGTLAEFLISKTNFLDSSDSLKNRYYLDSRLMGEAFKVTLLKK